MLLAIKLEIPKLGFTNILEFSILELSNLILVTS